MKTYFNQWDAQNIPGGGGRGCKKWKSIWHDLLVLEGRFHLPYARPRFQYYSNIFGSIILPNRKIK